MKIKPCCDRLRVAPKEWLENSGDITRIILLFPPYFQIEYLKIEKVFVIVLDDGNRWITTIEYCPSCGTKLEVIEE